MKLIGGKRTFPLPPPPPPPRPVIVLCGSLQTLKTQECSTMEGRIFSSDKQSHRKFEGGKVFCLYPYAFQMQFSVFLV